MFTLKCEFLNSIAKDHLSLNSQSIKVILSMILNNSTSGVLWLATQWWRLSLKAIELNLKINLPQMQKRNITIHESAVSVSIRLVLEYFFQFYLTVLRLCRQQANIFVFWVIFVFTPFYICRSCIH